MALLKLFNIKKFKQGFAEKVEMYDTILANLIAGNSVIESDINLDNSGYQ